MLFARNVEAPPTFSKVVENRSVTRQGIPSSQEDLGLPPPLIVPSLQKKVLTKMPPPPPGHPPQTGAPRGTSAA
eukprot:6900582-Heterocapsa_arctica.AAC.1